MPPGDLKGGGGWSRKGFRETGRAGGSSNGEAGEVARLRKGLLEERLRVRPVDACKSVAMEVSGASDQQLPSGRMQLRGTGRRAAGGGSLGVMGTDETGQSPRHGTTEQRRRGPTAMPWQQFSISPLPSVRAARSVTACFPDACLPFPSTRSCAPGNRRGRNPVEPDSLAGVRQARQAADT